MCQWVDCGYGGLSIAYTENAWIFSCRCERPVEEATAIAEAIAVPVETDDRCDYDIRFHDFRAACRNWDIPDAAFHRIAGSSCAEDQRLSMGDYHGQSGAAPARRQPT